MPLSAPFIRIRTGLLTAQHLTRMGKGTAMMLYLYLHSRVWMKGERAGTTVETYRHDIAAAELGVSERQVRRWFNTLRAGGYVVSRRLQYGLEVTITKYGAGDSRSDIADRSEPSRSDKNGHSADAQIGQIWSSDRTNLVIRSDTDGRSADGPATATANDSRGHAHDFKTLPSGESRDSREQESITPPLTTDSRESAAASFASEPTKPALDLLDRFNATLLGEKGYEPSPAFLLKVREKYGHLDLEEEALKARDWAKRHRRACSHGYLLNWLKKAAAEHAAAGSVRAGKAPTRNEPPPLPGPVVPAPPEARAELEAIRSGRRPKVAPIQPAEFERKRREVLAQAQQRIGVMP